MSELPRAKVRLLCSWRFFEMYETFPVGLASDAGRSRFRYQALPLYVFCRVSPKRKNLTCRLHHFLGCCTGFSLGRSEKLSFCQRVLRTFSTLRSCCRKGKLRACFRGMGPLSMHDMRRVRNSRFHSNACA